MQRRDRAGRCPTCNESLSSDHVLFETEFESADGSISYAKCPACAEVVNPIAGGSRP